MWPCLYKYDIVVNVIKVGNQESMKILGITLDKMLTFKDHISGQLKKACAKSAALRRVRRFVPTEVTISLYNSFVLPHLEYCSSLFLGVGNVQASRLVDTNFYILRSILDYGKNISYHELLGLVNMKTLEHRKYAVRFCYFINLYSATDLQSVTKFVGTVHDYTDLKLSQLTLPS